MTNKTHERGEKLRLAVGSGVRSNDPVMIGGIPFVATTDYAAADGKASLDGVGGFTLSVKGVNDAGNHAIAAGDAIYYTAGDTPVLSAKASGRLFGFALAAVLTSATTAIEVLLASPSEFGSGSEQLMPVFQSAELTGTGSAQNSAHGLGVVPRIVAVIPTDTSVAVVGVFVVTYGTHTTTNAVVTVTSGKKFMVIAIP